MKYTIPFLACMLFAALPAFSAPFDLLVNVGGVDYLRSGGLTTWSGQSAGGGYNVTSPDPSGNVWLYSPPYFGLTDTTFTCTSAGGCGGFQFHFTVLGETIANLAHVNINMNGNAAGGSFDAQYFVSCSGPTPCIISTPISPVFTLSGGFSVGGAVRLR